MHKIFNNLGPLYRQKNLRDIHNNNNRSSGSCNYFVPNFKGVEDSTFYSTGIKD